MDLDEFFKALETHCKHYAWNIVRGGAIRVSDGSGLTLGTACPITALASALKGHNYSIAQYSGAAADIGLSVTLCAAIAKAADKHYEFYDTVIRKRLESVLINNHHA